MKRSVSILLFLCSLTTLPASGKKDGQDVRPDEAAFTAEKLVIVKEQLRPLGEEGWEYEAETLCFFSHYGADDIPGTIRFSWFQSGERKLASYIFMPPGEKPKGTVYLIHGYLDHSLSNTGMIEYLVNRNYAVAAFDLPGHGFSDGPAVDIDDFREYAFALQRFINLTGSEMPKPFYGLAHSTGCSVIMECLNLYDNEFEKIIFAAPLIKSVGWRLTPAGLTLTDSFMDEVPRRFGRSNSNDDYEDFVEHNDPLQSRTVPYSWIYAYEEWNDRMNAMSPREDLHFSILQGEKDKVVDYEYNIPFIRERYPLSDVYYFPNGEHSLFNEVSSIRNSVFIKVAELLEAPPAASEQ